MRLYKLFLTVWNKLFPKKVSGYWDDPDTLERISQEEEALSLCQLPLVKTGGL